MKLRDSLRLAGRSLAGHRLRSALTVVGIVIGISTVVIFASFGTSVQTDVVGEFEGTAASEIIVTSGDVGFGDGSGGPPIPTDLLDGIPAVTDYDVEQLGGIGGVEAVIPSGPIDADAVTVGEETLARGVQVTAVPPAAFTEGDIVAGEPFASGARGEIVLTETAVERFEANVTVGDTVTVDYADASPEEFTVVGVTSSVRGGFSSAFSPIFYLPIEPYYAEYGSTAPSASQGVEQRAFPQVTLVAPPDRVTDVQADVERYMTADSDAIRVENVNDVTVQSTADIVDGIESVLADVIRLVSGIGLLALLVGAFGIANIMLVSVTERTKEIGIMKATGARNREVMGLFLGEAVLLGLAGAVVGIPLGLAVGYGAAAYAEVGFTVPVIWLVVAAGMGIATGVVSGLYPAWRAARVDPIDALRYE